MLSSLDHRSDANLNRNRAAHGRQHLVQVLHVYMFILYAINEWELVGNKMQTNNCKMLRAEIMMLIQIYALHSTCMCDCCNFGGEKNKTETRD
jgi:hypothetical protein